ncbi:MAG: hypothetical protein JJU06_16715 [Ectothiorhodospiraceae bacterium]|nr:hypothetical protein [Ectothiorhodospiraceae bacterium]MCH8503817.1 hypothetical protein [Ectothiorhodospiraceae bacterium]
MPNQAAHGMESHTIGHIRPDTDVDARDAYFLELLDLALSRTEDDFGPYRLAMAPVQMTQSRAIRSLREEGYVDVIWTMTSMQRERELLPVRIPLLRGLMGVRVPVVRMGEQDLLMRAEDTDALREFRAGQGHDWPDTAILEANGFPVALASDYESLFRMLQLGRIDHVPRSVAELGAELALYDAHDLTVANGPLMVYHAPAYFFVAPDNLRLALRLEVGLQRILADGSFHRLFRSHPANRHALHGVLLEERPIIWLENPLLPEDTPVDDPRLWYEPIFGRERGAEGS